MKKLSNITEDQVKHVCNLLGEPFLSYMTNSDGKWNNLGLEIQIETTSTRNRDVNDSCIWIFKNGTIRLHRNNGDWNGSRDIPINTLPIIDYLRECGYTFN